MSTEWYIDRLKKLIKDNALAEVVDLTVLVEDDFDEFSHLSKKRRDYLKTTDIEKINDEKDKKRIKQYREQLKKGTPGGIDSEGNRYTLQ